MKKNERCLAILEILQKQHKVTVTELAEKFDISEMTVRRDLNSLAREYNISRTHGGAELGNQPVVRMISFDEPRIAHKDSKDKIAALAATMIQNGQRIFIDAGSTTRIILNYLEEDTRAVVVTHHLAVAEQALKFENLAVIMLGGGATVVKGSVSEQDGLCQAFTLLDDSWILHLLGLRQLDQMGNYMTDILRKPD